jgi:hypothetical protein
MMVDAMNTPPPPDRWAKFTAALPARMAPATESAPAPVAAPPAAAPMLPERATVPAVQDSAARDDDEYPLPLGARLRGDWFPLYMDRFLGSRLVSTADHDVIGVSVILWASAMRQDPAGTLPDDDHELCHMVGLGRDVGAWLDLRARGALRKWRPYLCLSSGTGEAEEIRLGHPVLAEIALDVVTRVYAQAERSRMGSQRSLASRMRRAMESAGAHAGLTTRSDFVDRMIEELRARGQRWTAPNVRAAMERLDPDQGGPIIGMRRRE